MLGVIGKIWIKKILNMYKNKGNKGNTLFLRVPLMPELAVYLNSIYKIRMLSLKKVFTDRLLRGGEALNLTNTVIVYFLESSSIKSLKAPERKMAPFFQQCDDEFQ